MNRYIDREKEKKRERERGSIEREKMRNSLKEIDRYIHT